MQFGGIIEKFVNYYKEQNSQIYFLGNFFFLIIFRLRCGSAKKAEFRLLMIGCENSSSKRSPVISWKNFAGKIDANDWLKFEALFAYKNARFFFFSFARNFWNFRIFDFFTCRTTALSVFSSLISVDSFELFWRKRKCPKPLPLFLRRNQ